MGWKDWPYWVKGGIIASIMFVGLISSGVIMAKFLNMETIPNIIAIIISITSLPLSIIGIILLLMLPNILFEAAATISPFI